MVDHITLSFPYCKELKELNLRDNKISPYGLGKLVREIPKSNL